MIPEIDLQDFFNWVSETYDPETALEWVDYYNKIAPSCVSDPDEYAILHEMLRERRRNEAGPSSPNQMIGGYPGDGESRL